MKTLADKAIRAFSVVLTIAGLTILSPQAWSQQQGQSLAGTYRLASVQRQVEGQKDTATEKGVSGYLIITPKAYALIYTDAQRKYGSSVSEKAALWDSLTAHAGTYRIEGGKFIMLPSTHANESFVGSRQSRDWQIKGNHLLLTSEPRPYARDPSKKVVSLQDWEKVD
jgi:hypothetical protein